MHKVGFLQEDNGSFSATRLAFLAWVFGTLIMWGISSFQATDRKMQEIPESVQVLIGILMSGKVVQKFREEQSEPEPSDANNATVIVQPVLQPSTNGLVAPAQTQAAGNVAAQ